LLNEAVIKLLSRSRLIQHIVEKVEEWPRQTPPKTTSELVRPSGS